MSENAVTYYATGTVLGVNCLNPWRWVLFGWVPMVQKNYMPWKTKGGRGSWNDL
jgi:hypothetical protein